MLKNSSSDILEFITAFLIAADITRAASVPAKLISTCTASPLPRFAVLAAYIVSPSAIVPTGLMQRAYAFLAIDAILLSSALLNAALVIIAPIVVLPVNISRGAMN